jgi:hypothetical protein
MRPDTRRRPWRTLILLALFFASVAGSPATAAPDQLKECPPEGCTVRINGLTGDIDQGTSFYVARPLTKVSVEVCPADLINYRYEIVTLTSEELKEGFPIAGAGTVFTGTGGGQVAALAPSSLSLGESKPDSDLLDCYENIRTSLIDQRKGVQALVKMVNDVVDAPFAGEAKPVEAKSTDAKGVEGTDKKKQNQPACEVWPAKVANLGNRFESMSTPLLTTLDRLNSGNQSGKAACEKDGIEGLLAKIIDRDLHDQLQGKTSSGTFRGSLKSALLSLQGTAQGLIGNISDARKVVGRISGILSENISPVAKYTITTTQVSTRYTLGVKRTPITDQARRVLPAGTDPAKIDPSTIASFTFENRALHRFNVSMGMAGVWRGDNRAFEVAPSFDSDNKVSYHVRQSNHDSIKVEGAAFLGIYLGKGVDNFNPERKRAYMVMLGSEISSSPSEFFVGFGIDWPSGVILGIGATEYQSVSPGQGWKVGQVVPLKLGTTGAPTTDPVISTVPVEKKNAVGVYLFLGFRPAIFKAFLTNRKP